MNNVLTSQRERASRLLSIRKSLKLSRDDFSNTIGIAKGTLQHWENKVDQTGLTVRGAARLEKALRNYGIVVTAQWLLEGIGEGPIIPNAQLTANLNNKDFILSEQEEKNIADEIKLFHQHYKNAVSYVVQDNKMQPLYNQNDRLAGVKLYGENIQLALNKVCIVMTSSEELLLRLVNESNVPLQYELTQLNNRTTTYISELKFAAPVVLMRKPVNVG